MYIRSPITSDFTNNNVIALHANGKFRLVRTCQSRFLVWKPCKKKYRVVKKTNIYLIYKRTLENLSGRSSTMSYPVQNWLKFKQYSMKKDRNRSVKNYFRSNNITEYLFYLFFCRDLNKDDTQEAVVSRRYDFMQWPIRSLSFALFADLFLFPINFFCICWNMTVQTSIWWWCISVAMQQYYK